MLYNTRRKSLSFPALSIHLPVAHASRAAARLSPPSASPNSENPPSEKLERSHEESPSMSPPLKRTPLKYENTPPPSPEAETDDLEAEVKPREIDLEGINDEIVEGVIVLLQKTGNKPHLVKELAAILSQSVKIVKQSANPSRIISSRLSSYLKRPWTALTPCPVVKELEIVHPRRTYFYLTTYPHQLIPDPSTVHFQSKAIISLSISSAASRSNEANAERRRELSPSPEVYLFSPIFEDDDIATPTPTGSFSGRPTEAPRNNRATSPPLEKDEKKFTQTAREMQKRKLSADIQMSGVPSEITDHPTTSLEADFLFGEARNLNVLNTSVFTSSPAMKPTVNTMSFSIMKRPFEDSHEMWTEASTEWDMRSPEKVELDELDGMFNDF
ncbi:hypothetical protein IFR05_009423 [Cadophora sp. M221]|nr:hypothetical protein IFR05_009423 [Cadophora sp. M221]